jgi:uncharacterized protein (DUF2267 family)
MIATLELDEARRPDLMPTAHITVIDRSAQQAHVWINDVAEELGTEDLHEAYRVLRAFLHGVRDHLPVDEVAQLAAQLPIFIRGVLYEGWEPSRTPDPDRGLDSFLRRMGTEARLAGETQASFAAAAAARVLDSHVSSGEARSVLHALPRDLRRLLESAETD